MIRKTNEMKPRKNVILIDDSDATCRMTLWGEEMCNHEAFLTKGNIVGIKSAQVREWNG